MTTEYLLSKVDHTLLKPEATFEQIKTLCNEAVAYKTASVCINPGHVKAAAQYLAGRIPVCTVVGFPLGATTTAAKVFEAKEAIENGASEIDMVINIGALKAGDTDLVLSDIKAVKEACGSHILKVIITDDEKRKMCQIVEASGADFIKTSTGFSTGGATFEDVKLFQECLGGRVKIKAAGGIRSVEDMEKFLSLGADRLGTSSAIKILNAARQ